MSPLSTRASFVRFAMLSGGGWCLDVALFGGAVAAGAPPFAANLASSLTAASLVFLASRRLAFARATGAGAQRSAAYAAYTLAVILVAARAIASVAPAIEGVAGIAPAAAALAAKVAVTPPQLLLNFLVARVLAERALAHG